VHPSRGLGLALCSSWAGFNTGTTALRTCLPSAGNPPGHLLVAYGSGPSQRPGDELPARSWPDVEVHGEETEARNANLAWKGPCG
jgi:hypothetical protein